MTNIHTHNWVYKIVPSLAFAAGIIMASIGGIMTISSTAKLILFDHDSYDMVTRADCEFDYNYRPMPVPMVLNPKKKINEVDSQPRKRTEDEIKKCLDDRKKEMKDRFQQKKKQNLVDGISVLFVGLILIVSFRSKRKKS